MSAADEQAQRGEVDGNTRLLTRGQLLVAVLGHLLIGTLLVFGVQCSPKPPEEVIIQAVLLEDPIVGEKPVTVEAAVKPEPLKPKPEPPKPKPEPPKPDPEQLQKEAKVAELKQQAEATKREQNQLLAQAKAEEKVRQADEKAKLDADNKAKQAAEDNARRVALDAELKRLQTIEDAKRKAADDAENKRKAEEKARAQALAAQIAAEENARMAAVRADSQALWARALSEAIRRNWLRPPGADTFTCLLKVRMQQTGQVINATIVSTCGSPILDDSVVSAVYKASPLPLPSEPSAFLSELTFRFKP